MRTDKLLKYFLLSAFFLLLIVFESRYTLSKDYAHIAEADLLKRNSNAAFESAKHAIIFNIHNEQAYAVMAKLYLMLFEQTHNKDAFHTAFVAIRNAINNDPYEAFYYDFAGSLYLSNNDYTNAVRMYEIAITLYPHYLYFQNQLALLYHLTGKNDKALAILDDQSKLYKDYVYASHPDSIDIVNAYFLKACIFYKTDKYNNTLDTLGKIMAIAQNGISLNNPERRDKRTITLPQIKALAQFDTGLIYKKLGEHSKAQTFFTESYNTIPALKSNNSFLLAFNICE